MLSNSFGIAVIPLSLGISGLIFVGVAYFLKHKYSYKGGVKTIGELVGFRKLDNDHYIEAVRYALGRGKYQDFGYNVTNSKPIIRFFDGEKVVETHSEWSVGNLDKPDIGKKFPVRYFISGNGKYQVILEGTEYEGQRTKGCRIIFWVFAGIGYVLLGLAVFTVVLYQCLA